jgi:hypothetical protein
VLLRENRSEGHGAGLPRILYLMRTVFWFFA